MKPKLKTKIDKLESNGIRIELNSNWEYFHLNSNGNFPLVIGCFSKKKGFFTPVFLILFHVFILFYSFKTKPFTPVFSSSSLPGFNSVYWSLAGSFIRFVPNRLLFPALLLSELYFRFLFLSLSFGVLPQWILKTVCLYYQTKEKNASLCECVFSLQSFRCLWMDIKTWFSLCLAFVSAPEYYSVYAQTHTHTGIHWTVL